MTPPDLALCYWREGAYDEARVLLTNAFEGATDAVWRAKLLTRLVTVEFSAGRLTDAYALLREHARVFDEASAIPSEAASITSWL